jgi:hypothetical protein
VFRNDPLRGWSVSVLGMLSGGRNAHPVATRRAMVVWSVATVVGGGIAAWLVAGWLAGVFVAAFASLGLGGMTWLFWPRDGRE